jgi:hypothetical protein
MSCGERLFRTRSDSIEDPFERRLRIATNCNYWRTLPFSV